MDDLYSIYYNYTETTEWYQDMQSWVCGANFKGSSYPMRIYLSCTCWKYPQLYNAEPQWYHFDMQHSKHLKIKKLNLIKPGKEWKQPKVEINMTMNFRLFGRFYLTISTIEKLKLTYLLINVDLFIN